MPIQTNLSDVHEKQQNGAAIANDKLLQVPHQNGVDQNPNDDDEIVPTADVVVPLDGGWGWVVVAASFFCNLIVDGIVMSAGMFAKSIATEFNASMSEVAFVSSILSGFYLIAGPFVSALANRWGFRLVTIVGSFIAAAAFFASSFASSVVYLYIIYGIVGGIGFSLIYIPAVITVGYYFERWRALATGIAMCGSGVGTFIMAPLSTYLIKEFGWRNALVVQAGIILCCALCGAMFRPLKSIQVTISEDDIDVEQKEKALPNVFTKPLAEGRYAFSVPNSSHNTWIGAVSNTRYPTAAEVFRGSGANLDRRTSITPSATPTVTSGVTQLNAGNIHNTTKKLEQLSKAQQKRSISGSATPEENSTVTGFNLHKELNTVGEDDENENEALIDGEDKPQLTARRHTVSGRRPIINAAAVKKLKENRTRHHQALGSSNRPLYRDDIFFSGSLLRIPQYQSQTSLGYHMSVTRMPTKTDVEEYEEESCKMCPESVRRTLATMLDMTLLKSPSFMLLAVSGFLTMMGFFVPFLYLKPRAIDGHMDEDLASFTISVIGISNTFARIVCGLLSSFKGVNANLLSNITITLGGLATIFSGYSITPSYQFTYAVIFGIAIACFSALRSIIAVDLMGIEKLTNAFGILMLFQGLAAVLGAPIAGAMYDATKNYDLSFYFAGTLITLSAILCYPISYVNKWEKSRALEPSKVSPAV